MHCRIMIISVTLPLILILMMGINMSDCKSLHQQHRSERESKVVKKTISSPGLLFGNPEVYGSQVNSKGSSLNGAESGILEDEEFLRELIGKRAKRSPLTKPQTQDEIDDDDEDNKDDDDNSDEDEITVKTTTTTTTVKSIPLSTTTLTSGPTSVAPVQGTTTTTTKPSVPKSQLTPSNSSQGQRPPGPSQGQGQRPPPGTVFGKPPPGTVFGKPPPGFQLPPGARPAGGIGPGGKAMLPFPPQLLLGGKGFNMSAGNKPKSKKGELYLPEDYSNLEIPKLDAGKLFGIKLEKLSAVPVLVFLNIRSVRDIDETNEEIVLDMDMKVEWVDGVLFDPVNALRSRPTKPITLNPLFLKKLWQPDIYIDELVRVQKTSLMAKPHTLLFSPTTGLVSYTFRTAVRLSCEMNFYYYPSDTHRCQFHLRSYSYFDADLDLSWLRNGAFLQDPGDPNFDLQIDSIEKVKIKQVFNEHNNDTYDGLTFTVLARRKLSFHMVQTYLPSVFFIIITWLCFLVPARMVEARIGISMTTLLTLTAMFSSVRESTPIVSYVKAIDIWMIFCIFFVFLTLLEFSLLVWIRSFREDAEEKRLEHQRELQERRGEKKKGGRDSSPAPSRTSVRSEDLKRYELFAEFIEKWAFLIFSIVFVVFNIIYWSWLLNSSDYFNWAVNQTHNSHLDDD